MLFIQPQTALCPSLQGRTNSRKSVIAFDFPELLLLQPPKKYMEVLQTQLDHGPLMRLPACLCRQSNGVLVDAIGLFQINMEDINAAGALQIQDSKGQGAERDIEQAITDWTALRAAALATEPDHTTVQFKVWLRRDLSASTFL
ncbi:hypothetical protein WMY93_014571 [Mugilogobius chulae]|uniref:Uncharacterized protein n=1 Tax=Mugilogobius chulae TaxID=88201 RepID=A0AAW0NVB4_9GOBI